MYIVNPSSEVVVDMRASVSPFDLEALFRSQYGRVARIIARVVRDPARAEDLAVEVFLKLWRNPKARGEKVEGWLYRVALRAGLDELRRQTRRARYEGLLGLVRAKRAPVTPEELHLATKSRIASASSSASSSRARRRFFFCAARASVTTKWPRLSI